MKPPNWIAEAEPPNWMAVILDETATFPAGPLRDQAKVISGVYVFDQNLRVDLAGIQEYRLWLVEFRPNCWPEDPDAADRLKKILHDQYVADPGTHAPAFSCDYIDSLTGDVEPLDDLDVTGWENDLHRHRERAIAAYRENPRW